MSLLLWIGIACCAVGICYALPGLRDALDNIDDPTNNEHEAGPLP